jgi:hypothetical protein
LIQAPVYDETEMCGNNIINEEQFLTNDQWHIDKEIRHAVFQGIFVVPSYKPVWEYVGV